MLKSSNYPKVPNQSAQKNECRLPTPTPNLSTLSSILIHGFDLQLIL